MHRQLPPFAGLAAFEASARLGSFKRAADELCLTQSAISHRIKELEEFIGASLFHRLTRKIVLTERGRAYVEELGDVMDRIEMATASVSRMKAGRVVSLRGTPAFINRWMAPRIGEFSARFQEVELHLSTSIECADFATDDVDISVEWGVTRRDGVEVLPFFETASFAVASPSLVRQRGPFRQPSDLRRATLLHNQTGDAWPQWLKAAGASEVDGLTGPRFEHCDLTLTAAVESQGVALCFGELAMADIEAGRLVRLFEAELPPRAIYSIAIPLHRARWPHIGAIRDWLLLQARERITGPVTMSA